MRRRGVEAEEKSEVGEDVDEDEAGSTGAKPGRRREYDVARGSEERTVARPVDDDAVVVEAERVAPSHEGPAAAAEEGAEEQVDAAETRETAGGVESETHTRARREERERERERTGTTRARDEREDEKRVSGWTGSSGRSKDQGRTSRGRGECPSEGHASKPSERETGRAEGGR